MSKVKRLEEQLYINELQHEDVSAWGDTAEIFELGDEARGSDESLVQIHSDDAECEILCSDFSGTTLI